MVGWEPWGAALLGVASPAASPPVTALEGLGPALTACFQAPEGTAGSTITVRFSLTRAGAVLGRPRVTYSKLVGPPALQQAFVRAALGALARCTPVALSPGLGGAVAGRPLTVTFVGGGPAQRI